MLENRVAEKTRQALTPIIEELGFEVVDVEYVKKPEGMTLTVYIDIPRGVTIDDCETVHNAVNPVIDALDPTGDQPYFFNISSPGLDRPFKTQRDYERNYGKSVEIKLYAPLSGTKDKLIVGKLVSYDDDSVAIETADGKTLSVKNSAAALVRPHIEF